MTLTLIADKAKNLRKVIMKKPTLIAVITLCSSMAFSAVHASGQSHYKGMHHRQHAHVAQALELTEAQQERLSEIRKEARREMKAARRDLGVKHRNTLVGLDPESADYWEQVQTHAQKNGEWAEQRVLIAAEKQAKVYEVLTPEQKEKMAELIEKRSEAKGKRHHKGKRHFKGKGHGRGYTR